MKSKVIGTLGAALLAVGIFAGIGSGVASAAPTTTVYPILSYHFNPSKPSSCSVFSASLDYSFVAPGATLTLRSYIASPGLCVMDEVFFTP